MSDCVACGKAFPCGMADAAVFPCWCTALPPLPAEQLGRAGAQCYCPDCLARLVAALHANAGEG